MQVPLLNISHIIGGSRRSLEYCIPWRILSRNYYCLNNWKTVINHKRKFEGCEPQSQRLHTSDPSDDSGGSAEYTSRQKEFVNLPNLPVSNILVKRLQELFGLPLGDCQEVLQWSVAGREEAVLCTMQYLHDSGVQGQQIKRLPWVLAYDKETVQSRLAVLLSGKTMFACPSDGLGLASYCLPTIRKYRARFYHERAHIFGHRNRIYYIAHNLKVPVCAVAETGDLCTAGLPIIKGVLQHVTDGEKISIDMGFEVPWLFSLASHPLITEHSRIKAPTADLKNLLSDHARCAATLSQYLYSTKRTTVHPEYITRTIQLLLRYGYTVPQIIKHVRVVNGSTQRILKRLDLLLPFSPQLPPFKILYDTQQQFNVYYDKMRLSNKLH